MDRRGGKLLVIAAVAAALASSCASAGNGPRLAAGVREWIPTTLPNGERLDLLVVAPESPARGVVVAFPWGRGDAGLLAGLVGTYWDEAAPAAGYAVVGVEAYGPGLEDRAEEVMGTVLGWVETNLPGAAERIILTGASAGGIGVFHAALAVPERVDAIVAMPGRASGDRSLAPLAGKPVLLLVGEHDGRWVAGSEATAERLRAAGADVTLRVLAGQGHVLGIAEAELLRWIESTHDGRAGLAADHSRNSSSARSRLSRSPTSTTVSPDS